MLCVCVCTTALANAVVQPAQQGIVRRGRTAAIEAHAAMRLLDTLDVGHMMKLEHINLGVGNKDTARIFYADGLGCACSFGAPFAVTFICTPSTLADAQKITLSPNDYGTTLCG
jgi:hypothetical protein